MGAKEGSFQCPSNTAQLLSTLACETINAQVTAHPDSHSYDYEHRPFFPLYGSLALNVLNGFYLHWSHFMVWLNLYGREPISFVLHLLNALYSQTNYLSIVRLIHPVAEVWRAMQGLIPSWEEVVMGERVWRSGCLWESDIVNWLTTQEITVEVVGFL